MTVSGSARLAGVVGWPVAQSLSPALHAHWLREHAVDGVYVPLPIRPEDFATALSGLRLAGFRGVNVTVPHKEAAFALSRRLDAAAEAIGAVNLLLFEEEGFEGRNTDAEGLMAALADVLGPGRLAGCEAVIWGAGGTARAAVYALANMGAAEVRILNRTRARAAAVAAALRPLVGAKLTAGGYELWAEAGKDAALLIHTTSAGMGVTPSIDLPLDILPADAAVFDVVYHPLETGLLARAKARGLVAVDGLGMLMHQAVPSFAAFYGIMPKVTKALRAELERALRHG